MRKLVAGVAASIALLGAPAGADGPHITDPANDANGLPISQDTGPASYGAADILTVTASTEHVAVPVGGNGVDHRPTALVLRFRTTASPIADVGTLAFGVHADLGGCSSSFVGYVQARVVPLSDAHVGKVRWVQFGECPDRVELNEAGVGTAADHPQWTATADLSARTVTLRIPFSTLTPAQAEALRPGARLASPSAMSFLSRSLYVISDAGVSAKLVGIDSTDVGSDFVIGSDVPADVPCTRNCS